MTEIRKKRLLGIYSCMCDNMLPKEIAEEMNISVQLARKEVRFLKEHPYIIKKLY